MKQVSSLMACFNLTPDDHLCTIRTCFLTLTLPNSPSQCIRSLDFTHWSSIWAIYVQFNSSWTTFVNRLKLSKLPMVREYPFLSPPPTFVSPFESFILFSQWLTDTCCCCWCLYVQAATKRQTDNCMDVFLTQTSEQMLLAWIIRRLWHLCADAAIGPNAAAEGWLSAPCISIEDDVIIIIIVSVFASISEERERERRVETIAEMNPQQSGKWPRAASLPNW